MENETHKTFTWLVKSSTAAVTVQRTTTRQNHCKSDLGMVKPKYQLFRAYADGKMYDQVDVFLLGATVLKPDIGSRVLTVVDKWLNSR